jgi:3-oxoacyl-[acyl-carrier protein] reductase
MGRATAPAHAAAGARIIVHYGRNAGEADAVVDQIRKAQGRADAISTDLAMMARWITGEIIAVDGGSKL